MKSVFFSLEIGTADGSWKKLNYISGPPGACLTQPSTYVVRLCLLANEEKSIFKFLYFQLT